MLDKKVSYMMGLLHGMDLDTTTKEGRALLQMAEVMEDMANEIGRLQAQINELTELCDIIDKDLGDVEYDLYQPDDDDDDDDDYDDDDDDDDDLVSIFGDSDDEYGSVIRDYDEDDDDVQEQYEVTCPNCEAQIIIDEHMLEQGSMLCPQCNENLEFDYNTISEAENADDESDSEA